MRIESVLPELVTKNDRKILLVVLDGLGGLPHPESRLTELETAAVPHLHDFARRSSCGLAVPVAAGVTPGSGPAHLGLFGYDPLEHPIGRGILEVCGIGMHVGSDDLAIRGNFATLDGNGIVTDRRAGRIPTDENRRLAGIVAKAAAGLPGAEVAIETVKEHRCAIVLKGPGLSPAVTENDPQKEGRPLPDITPLEPGATATAKLLNEFVARVRKALRGEKANVLLLRGFSKLPALPSFAERYLLRAACIATYPMYRGLAKLVGMDVLKTGDTLEDQIATLEAAHAAHDFFFFHVKKADAMGEDGNFDGKVAALETFDRRLPDLLKLPFETVVVTGDHSTPALLRGHSWHPVPFALCSPNALPDDVTRFTERACVRGILGVFPAAEGMLLMLAHSLKLQKYGA